MRFSLTLSTYFGRHFLAATGTALGGILVIASLIDAVELFRRTAEKAAVGFRIVMEMMILHLPYIANQLLPYGILFGAMMALIRLTRSQELIVARAAGISVWQFLTPALIGGAVIGILWVTIVNPVSASMIARYDALQNRYLDSKQSLFSISESDLWLRQVDSGQAVLEGKEVREYILRASYLTQSDLSLHDVTIFAYGDKRHFIGRIDTPVARLLPGRWQLDQATVSAPGILPDQISDYTLKTDLSIAHIQDSFADPSTISFWKLPDFIHMLQKAGFSALRHRLYWHSILAIPLNLAAMVLIAAVFSLRLHRKGKIGLMVVSGFLTGFFINFLTSLFHAFGNSGGLPILLAAWAPPALTLMIGTALLLHMEDG